MPSLAFVSPFFRVPVHSFRLFVLALAFVALGSTVSKPESASAKSLIAPTKACSNHAADGGKAAMKKARRAMVCMVNYARKQKKRKRFRQHSKLTWAAGRKAKDISRCEFSHTACGREFTYWIDKSGYKGRSVGENIAWGSGSAGSVRQIFIAWMKSPPHRKAILSRNYREVGPGVVKARFEGYEGARIWVLHFGSQ